MQFPCLHFKYNKNQMPPFIFQTLLIILAKPRWWQPVIFKSINPKFTQDVCKVPNSHSVNWQWTSKWPTYQWRKFKGSALGAELVYLLDQYKKLFILQCMKHHMDGIWTDRNYFKFKIHELLSELNDCYQFWLFNKHTNGLFLICVHLFMYLR